MSDVFHKSLIVNINIDEAIFLYLYCNAGSKTDYNFNLNDQ